MKTLFNIGDKITAGDIASYIFDTIRPVAGYSLRKLSNISGPVIRARRGIDNKESDFYADEIEGGELQGFATNDGASDVFVTVWYDQFGNNNATQTTAAEQPKIWDSTTGLLTEGGRPAIEFDGVDDFLSLNSIYFDNIFISIVGRDNDNLEGAFISGGDDGNNRFDFGTRTSTDTRILISESGVTERIEETVTDYTNAQHLFTATNTLLAVDGSIVSTGLIQVDILAYTDNFRIGQRHIAGVVTHSMIGTIQEIIIYNTDQSANREAIEDNINVYNSVTIPEMPSLICSCDAYKATKLYNINPA
jgi:hypothetical protein